MPADIHIEFDPDKLDREIQAMARDMRRADAEAVTNNAKRQLYLAVQGFPVRTGNLRSSATEPWTHLGMRGRPMTNLPPGEKFASYRDKNTGRIKSIRVKSWGRHEDRRDHLNPAYKYELWAAEWRERPSRYTVFQLLQKATEAGVLSRGEASAIRKSLAVSANWKMIYDRVRDLLRSGGAAHLLDRGGYWHPYSIFYKGTHRLVTGDANFQFTYEHKRVMEEHSA